MVRDGADDLDLWAMAAELERQFARYKQRLAGRSGGDDAPDVVGTDDDAHARSDRGDGRSNGLGEAEAGDGGGDVRGRMYEAYTRRRDERLRSGWLARMERKEAEVMALWTQLGRSGRRAPGGGGGGQTTAPDVDGTAGEQEAEDDGERRRSSDVAAPGRISGKKHARTRSFSSSALRSSRSVDIGRRRALSQESPPTEPPAGADGGASRKADGHLSRAIVGAAPKRKALPWSKATAKEHGSVKSAGPKPPRSLPRRCSSGGLEGLGREAALLPSTFVVAPVQMSCLREQAAAADHDEARRASSPMPFVGSGDGTGTGTGTENARAGSPESDRSEVVDGEAADGGEAEAKNVVDVEEITVSPETKLGNGDGGEAEAKNVVDVEEITVSPETKLGNGEVTSDSETEPSYVFIKKKDVKEEAIRVSEVLAAYLEGKNGVGSADEATTAPTADANVAAESATTNAEEAPAKESSGESSFSGRSGRSSTPNNGPPSCSSRPAQSIERLLEADAAPPQKKREESAGENSAPVSTPGSAGSSVSGTGTARTSPRETPRGFKKRFLSFGKKNKGREAIVIDCTSPSVPSPVDDGGASGRWQTADSINPRMGSSSDAASADTDHGYAASPQAYSLQTLVAASPTKSELSEIVPQERSPKAHRPFFSFRSFNCGRS